MVTIHTSTQLNIGMRLAGCTKWAEFYPQEKKVFREWATQPDNSDQGLVAEWYVTRGIQMLPAPLAKVWLEHSDRRVNDLLEEVIAKAPNQEHTLALNYLKYIPTGYVVRNYPFLVDKLEQIYEEYPLTERSQPPAKTLKAAAKRFAEIFLAHQHALVKKPANPLPRTP